jgi:eukaryotic-like serine/threonine-protein kinase
MSVNDPLATDHEQRLERVLADYLYSVEAGAPLDRRDLVTRHPDLADDLRSFFGNRDAVERLAMPLVGQLPSDLATIGLDAAAGDPNRVRYFGDYELIEELGRGGMGVVYRARQVSLNRPVALKMILSARLASESDIARFRAEAEAAANLDHPHITPIYEIGEHDGQHYFSMKLIAGASLRDLLPELRQNIRRGIELLSKVARAMHHAHQRGVLHRDLKPANIVIDAADEPYVTDFGLAKQVEGGSDLTRTGAIVGTPSYMAPEQATGVKVLSTAVDVYSLGAMLYELLTGRPPFQADSPLETVLQVTSREPIRPRTLKATADKDLETIALKCLEKDPTLRYDSAAALADELDRWLGGEPILARPTARVERFWRWCRRNPAIAGVSAAGIGCLIFAAAISSFYALEASRHADDARQQRDRAEMQLNRAERLLYAGHILAANREWDQNQIGAAWRALDATRIDLRGWEFDYLNTLFHRNQELIAPGNMSQVDLSLSPNGRWVVSCDSPPDDRGVFTVRNAQTGAVRHSFVTKAWPHQTMATAVNSAGTKVACAGHVGVAKIWDTATGRVLHEFTAPESSFEGLAFSPDGRWIAATSAPRRIDAPQAIAVRVWEVETGRMHWSKKGHPRAAGSFAFSPDSTRIATSDWEGLVIVWDVVDGRPLLEFKGEPAITCLAFSADGKQLVAGFASGTMHVWNAITGELHKKLSGHDERYSCVAFSPDGKQVAAVGGGVLRFWDVSTGRETLVLKGQRNGAYSLQYLGDGKHVLTVGGDGAIRTWDITRNQEPLVLSREMGELHGVQFSPDGSRIVTGDWRGYAQIWDAHTGRELFAFREEGLVNEVLFSPDGKWLAVARQTNIVQLHDVHSGKVLRSLKLGGPVDGLAFSPDSTRLVTGDWNGVVRVWSVASGEPLHTAQVEGWVTAVAYSPDGKRIAALADRIKMWDANLDEEVAVQQPATAHHAVVFSPDGKLVVACDDMSIRVWGAVDGRHVTTLTSHLDEARGLAFSADGTRLASAGMDDRVKLWDTETWQEMLSIRAHQMSAFCVAFSPDGKRLACGGSDSVKVWDTSPSR